MSSLATYLRSVRADRVCIHTALQHTPALLHLWIQSTLYLLPGTVFFHSTTYHLLCTRRLCRCLSGLLLRSLGTCLATTKCKYRLIEKDGIADFNRKGFMHSFKECILVWIGEQKFAHANKSLIEYLYWKKKISLSTYEIIFGFCKKKSSCTTHISPCVALIPHDAFMPSRFEHKEWIKICSVRVTIDPWRHFVYDHSASRCPWFLELVVNL